jgi:hypothetical protein
MSKRNKSSGNSSSCTCTKCGWQAVSTASTTHRRCSGQQGQNPRPKHQLLPGNERGTWQ